MSEDHSFLSQLFERYVYALKIGDEATVGMLVQQALSQGISAAELYMNFLMPAQIQIGELWHKGEISIAEEHRASHLTVSEMTRIHHELTPVRQLELRAVVVAIPGDPHFIGARLVADLLFFDGWQVDFLGAGIPGVDLLEFVKKEPYDLLALSATLLEETSELATLVKNVRSLEKRPMIILGGAAVHSGKLTVPQHADVILESGNQLIPKVRELFKVGSADNSLADYLGRLGSRIQEIRQRKNLTQTDLSKLCGLDRAYLSAVENGKQNITIGALLKIAEALGVSRRDLL